LIEPDKGQRIETSKIDIGEVNSKSKPALAFLGKNQKKVTVLVSEASATFITDDELAFLTKILNACNLNLSDIAIVNTASHEVSFMQLKGELQADYILMLGVEPASIQLPFTMPNFQVQQFSSCTIVCAPPLASMMISSPEGTLLKRQLWASLQKAFNLS
jgi:hypothetical protein